jgi:hypothetical protein
VTVPDLKPNSQETSAFHLYNIQKLLADPNISLAYIPPQLPPFSPPISAIWVNALLFLSLVISLTCALLATLLQQWARRYVRFAQPSGCGPHIRARIRAFFSNGVDNCHVSGVVEVLPTLVHASLSLFFAGLLIWLFAINHSVFHAVAWWVVLSAVAYIWITMLPLYRHDSPYYAPLSSTIWFLYHGTLYIVFKGLSLVFSTTSQFNNSMMHYRRRLWDGIRKTAEETAKDQSSQIYFRILCSTLDAMGEYGALKEFFKAVPGFFDSKLVCDLRKHLSDNFTGAFDEALGRFLDHTFSTSYVPESVKRDQLIICLNAAYAVQGSMGLPSSLLEILNTANQHWPELLQSVQMANSLRRWSKSTDKKCALLVRRIVAQTITGVRERDAQWISLTKAEYGVPDNVLRDNARHGDDSQLLSLLIHVTRQAFSSGSCTPFVLSSLTQFDIRNTRPQLQHEFCDLWNDIVREAWKGKPGSTAILRDIRHAFLELHQGTDAIPIAFSSRTYHFEPVLDDPLSYHACNIASHRQDWTPQAPVTNHLTVAVTPTRAGSSSSAVSITQIGDSPGPSPLSTPMEFQRDPGKPNIIIISSNSGDIPATPQQADEANVVLRFPSSTNLTIGHFDDNAPHMFTSRSSAPSPVYITQQLHPIPLAGIPHQPSQSTLSVANTDANHVRPEDTMTEPYSSEIEEISQVSVAASLPVLHFEPLPTISYSSTGSITPPSSVPDPDQVLNAPQCLVLATTSLHLPEGNQRQDIAIPNAASDTSETSPTASPISHSIAGSGATLQRGEGITIAPATVFPVSDYQSPHIPMPAAHNSVIPAQLPSSVGPTCGYIEHPLGSSSSLSGKRPHVFLHSSVTPSNSVSLAHGGNSEMERPIPMQVFSDSS